MQPTLSLTRRTHLFVKDDKLYFKLYKQSRFTDKKDYSVVNAVPVAEIPIIKAWLEQAEQYLNLGNKGLKNEER